MAGRIVCSRHAHGSIYNAPTHEPCPECWDEMKRTECQRGYEKGVADERVRYDGDITAAYLKGKYEGVADERARLRCSTCKWLIPETELSHALCDGSSGAVAELAEHETFGCVCWEPKAIESPEVASK